MSIPRHGQYHNRNRRGSVLVVTGIALVFIVPMVGLSIDCGILYAVKTKLSGACDAGALAGARALSRGLDGPSQQASAISTAKSYIKMNFPNGYFGTPQPNPPDPTVDTSIANQRSVSVSATVNAPTYFMKWLGYTTIPITATATAVRRDVNVVIVMDRSHSLTLSASCAPLKADAVNFVNKFANGRDNLGLVTFATSSKPDFPLATNFLTASPSATSILNSIDCEGGTNSAQGLYQGYQQLVQLAQPGALNVLVFFTDGYPTAVTATFPIKASSTCSSKTPKTAVLTAGFNSGVSLINPVSPFGLLYQVASNQPMASDQTLGPPGNYSGCAYASSFQNVAQDVTYIPSQDVYGNAMNTNYQPTPYYDGNGNIVIDAKGQNIVNASVNAADSMGLRIRQGAVLPGVGGGIPNVRLYSIGLGNSGGVADDFMERIANDPRASNYDKNSPQGQYIYAPTSADISDAFTRVASEILRLAK